MNKPSMVLQRALWFTFFAVTLTCKVATADAEESTKSETYENWTTDEEIENQVPVSQNTPCQGEVCLYGNRQLARRKLLKRKTVCGQGGCLLNPEAKSIDHELDAAEMDTYGIQYNQLPRDSSCQGQMCWFRGKREKFSASNIQERLLAQLSFLRELNKKEMNVNNGKRAQGELGCTGQMCWFRGKKEYDESQDQSSCVGQMCWFRGKRTLNAKGSKSCTGQMCWFRGKRNMLTKDGALKKELNEQKRCTGQMCWFRGGRSLDEKGVDGKAARQKGKRSKKEDMCTGQMCWFRGGRSLDEKGVNGVAANQNGKRTQKETMCTGQMCWFRGRKELQAHQMGCKGQMCWFRGKRNAKHEIKN